MELAHLLTLALQSRPLVLGLPANLVGKLACLRQRLLVLAGDLRSKLLGLVLRLANDVVRALPDPLDQLLARAARGRVAQVGVTTSAVDAPYATWSSFPVVGLVVSSAIEASLR